ncbi:E3 ubiquitin-protein ligase bre1, partial [Rhizopus stolonifer]
EQAVKTQLEEHRIILSAREKEIEALKRDRQTLLQDEDRLLSLFKLSEEQLLETEYIKTLQLSIDHYRSRCHDLEQRRVDLERDLDKMSAARKQLIDQVKTEKISQNMTMESEIRRMEGDLNRIRGQRDSFQSLVDEQKMKENREKESQEKIMSFATQGKTRISSLESRIDRLKNEQEMAGPFEKEATMYSNLKEQLIQMDILLSSIELIENRDVESILCFDTESLQKSLEKCNSHPLVKEYDQVLEESRKATLMADFFEKNEGHLLEEIDRVASIYGKLEEQQGKKVFDFSQKRDQILKLQAEVEKENELRKLNRNIEEDRIDLEDISHVCDDYRVTIDQNDILLVELQKMMKEKTKVFDEEKQLQESVKESYDKMKKKWEKMSQGENPMEQQLAEECDELRALLKCNTCRTRFRSHILIRCMHTFCKNCIDARLETRQRRCPTCSEPFGANDVKNFYL